MAQTGTIPDIGEALHQYRRDGGLTLDELSRRAGVSKSMLSQIERNLTNPTFATVWRLTQALGVSLEDVLPGAGGPAAAEVIGHHQIPAITSRDGRIRLRILSPVDMAGVAEWYELRAESGGALVSEPHEAGTVEHLTLMSGELTVEFGGESRNLAAGDTIRYPADLPHAIRNHGTKPATAMLVCTIRVGN